MIEHLKMILIHLFLQRLQCFWVHIPVKFLESKDKGYLEFTERTCNDIHWFSDVV